MKNSLQRAIALLMAMLFAAACMPVSALADIVEASGSNQPFLRAINPENTPVVTYQFLNEDDSTYAEAQRVKDGEMLLEPAKPEKAGYKFLGWSSTGTAPYQVFGPQTVNVAATITLKPVFEQVYYVFFHDDQGRVYQTKEGTTGQNVTTSDVTFPVSTDKGITGWYMDEACTVPANDPLTIGTANVHLYPKVETGCWITFTTGDQATYIAPVFVAPGQATLAPEPPTRPGYGFAGWKNGDTDFTFGATLAQDITLTAQWTPQTVNYTVIYWQENANYQNTYLPEDQRDPEQYSFMRAETMTGLAGSSATVQAAPLEGFTVQPVTTQTIAGDGSTIVNVYYNRNVYEVEFYTQQYRCGLEAHEHTYIYWNHSGYRGGCYPSDQYSATPICGKTAHQHDRSCGSPTSMVDNSLTITAKYGASIGSAWPGGMWKVDDDPSRGEAQSNLLLMPLNGFVFYQMNQQNGKMYYYVEALDRNGTQVSGKYFTLHHTDTVYRSGTTTAVDYYPIEGFTVDWQRSTSVGSRCNGAEVYYTRNTYEIVFMSNGAQVATVDKLYQENIADVVAPTPETLQALTPPPGKEDYTFAGWTWDSAGTETATFEGTMPAKNLIVYAKWVPPLYTVTVYNDMEGADQQSQKTYDKGSKIDRDDLTVPAYDSDKYNFIGWATKTVNADGTATFTPYNFDTEIYENISLYPYMISKEKFQVTYDPNGGKGSVTDSKQYAQYSYADIQPGNGLTPPKNQVFLGWNTEPNGTGTTYAPNDKIQITENVTLYALYGLKPAGATLTYHSNFTTKDQNEVSVPVVLSNNAEVIIAAYEAVKLPSRQGYTFVGWSTTREGNVEYHAGDKVIIDNKDENAQNHLYAQWTRQTADLTINKLVHDRTATTAAKKTFTFTITMDEVVTSEELEAWVQENGFEYDSTQNCIVATVSAEDGVWASVTLPKLPTGKYKIYEDQNFAYTTKYAVGDKNAARIEGTGSAGVPNGEISFENSLKTSTLTVNKMVAGNMADKNEEFEFTAELFKDSNTPADASFATGDYTLESPNKATFKLKHGESMILNGIPYNYMVRVTEKPKDYTASNQNGQEQGGETTLVGPFIYDNASVTFTNTKTATIDTGVNLDMLPYILLLAVAGGAIVLLLALRSRRGKED